MALARQEKRALTRDELQRRVWASPIVTAIALLMSACARHVERWTVAAPRTTTYTRTMAWVIGPQNRAKTTETPIDWAHVRDWGDP